MSPMMKKGLIVAALHVAIVGSLGAKLLVDRATRPRVWARAAPVDPNLPIRGRYVSLRVEAAPGADWPQQQNYAKVAVTEQGGRLIATISDRGDQSARIANRNGERVAIVEQPLAFFIPEHVADPSRRPAGEELWVEVTIPRAGRPRPIRLGVRKDGQLTPLALN